MLGSIAVLLAAPLMGLRSDRIARKKVVGLGALAYATFCFAFFPLVDGHVLGPVTVAYLVLNVLMAAPQGLGAPVG